MENYLSLAGQWQMSDESNMYQLGATLPGDNYSALLGAGLIPDPYFGRNEQRVQFVAERAWRWTREFDVPAALLDFKAVFLTLTEVDTVAEFYLNGRKVLTMDNQFRRYRIEVKKYLRAGQNRAEFRIASPAKAACERAERAEKGGRNLPIPWTSNNTLPHQNYLRKVGCHAGWDWGISLPVSGVYGEMTLTGVDVALLEYLYPAQRHLPDGSVEVTLTAELTAVTPGPAEVVFGFGEEECARLVTLKRGLNQVAAVFTVKQPQLWWPNGFGAPFLYDAWVATPDEGKTIRVGLRRLEVVRHKDKAGMSMIVTVNRVPVFCKGANWIPVDAFPERQTRETYADLLDSAVAANMNMIRLWGGGQYEKDDFYELCDEKGLLIWHDCMFACSLYPSLPEFIANVREELTYQFKRLRHHAAIALWCGDNEVIGAINWYEPSRRDPKAYAANYDRLNRAIAETVELCDPERIFWPSSPCAGPGSFGDNWHNDGAGDMHYWAVWHEGAVFEDYYKVRPRFCSEFGFQSFPSPELAATFTSEDDRNVFSPVMNSHQKCPRGNVNIIAMFAKYFRMPAKFDDFLYLSQVQQALAIKTAVEYWRTLQPHCMGTLFWQLNDNWPVASWSSVEYGGNWKQLQYHAKRFYQPLAGFVVQRDGEAIVTLVNDAPVGREVAWQAVLYDFAGTPLQCLTGKATLASCDTETVLRLAINRLPVAPEACFMVVDTASDGVETHRTTHFFAPYRDCELGRAQIKCVVKGNTVTLSTDCPAFFVTLGVAGQRGIFSDNSITLLPGEKAVLDYLPRDEKKLAAAALAIRHLRETY